MSSKLNDLHELVTVDLITKIQSGEATAAELNAAIKFLKDNGIDCVGEQNPKMVSLARQFPEFNEEDMYTH